MEQISINSSKQEVDRFMRFFNDNYAKILSIPEISEASKIAEGFLTHVNCLLMSSFQEVAQLIKSDEVYKNKIKIMESLANIKC